MKLTYLGTAAAEAVPCCFCPCEACERARREGGREVRTRSGAMIDDVLKIDLPPDTMHHVTQNHLDLSSLEHVLITHAHADHFAFWQLVLFGSILRHRAERNLPLHVYGNDAVGKVVKSMADPKWQPFHPLEPFRPVDVAGYRVTPLRALHAPGQTALFYMIQRDGKTIIYAHDTGPFPDDTMEYLRGGRADLISLDATNGVKRFDYVGHMGISDDLELRERLLVIGAARSDTIFVANHFSHNGLTDFESLQRAAPGFVISYDGLQIEI